MFTGAIFKMENMTGLAGNRRFVMECSRSRLVLLLRRIYGVCLLIVSALISQIALAGGAPASDNRHYDLDLDMDPPFTFVDKSRDIKFSVLMKKGVNDVVDTVRLVETNAEESPIAEVGIMNDDGRDGDYKAKDWEYTFTLPVNEPNPVTRHYQVVASLKNDSRKILSEIREFRVTEKPYSKEPDEDKLVHGMGAPFPVNQLVVRLAKDETKSTAKALADSVDGAIVGYTPTVNLYLFEVPATTVEELDAISERLKNDPRVAGVMTNTMIEFE